jgi:hypothetical protein
MVPMDQPVAALAMLEAFLNEENKETKKITS